MPAKKEEKVKCSVFQDRSEYLHTSIIMFL